MMILISFAYFILIPLSLVVFFLCLQVLLGLFSFKKFSEPVLGDRQPVTVLIPAHNESLVIEQTLEHLMKQLNNKDKVVVVADNCNDNTIELAKKFKVNVIVRTNEELKGKGYALDFGIRHIEVDPTEIVVILDADCIVEDNAIEQLTIAAYKYKCPIQALYLMNNQDGSNNTQKISQFAFFIKNHIRPLGLKFLGLPCQLMGSGMAFPWELIKNAELANGDLVEDMKLGIDCAIHDSPTVFLPSAKVTSYFPIDSFAKTTQSTRWEHGHLSTIKNYVPKLLKIFIQKRDIKFALFALDLAIPPLSLLMIALVISSLLLAIISLVTSYNFLTFSTLLFVSFIFSILTTWVAYGRNIITMQEMLKIPFYIIKKLSIYLSFITNKQVTWIRTVRNKK